MWILFIDILLLSTVSAYIGVPMKKTWRDAQAYCRDKYGTNLATIRNDKDATTLASMAKVNVSPHPFGEVWIGLNDIWEEGFWLFSDLSGCPTIINSCDKLKYWYPGKPNNSPGKQPVGSDCAHIITKDTLWKAGEEVTLTSMLDDWDCNHKFYFICDSPCRFAGFNSLSINHHCECRIACDEDNCNSFDVVREKTGGLPDQDASCPDQDIEDTVCCCSCPNCPGYSDLFQM
eukprot:137928_1